MQGNGGDGQGSSRIPSRSPLPVSLPREPPARWHRHGDPWNRGRGEEAIYLEMLEFMRLELQFHRGKEKEKEEEFIERMVSEAERNFADAMEQDDRPIPAVAHGILFECALVAVFFINYFLNTEKYDAETIYQVLSMFIPISLQLLFCEVVISLLIQKHINYIFLFEFYSTKKLKYMEILLILIISTLLVATFPHISTSVIVILRVIGVILFLMYLIVLIFILYHLIRLIWFSFCKEVTMVDAFMADQLCSLAPVLGNLVHVTCYYLTGSYKMKDYGLCIANAVTLLPFFLRAMQCGRLWFEKRENSHGINLGRYASAMLDLVAKMIYEEGLFKWFKGVFMLISCITTLYQFYWDSVKDWGLLQFNSWKPSFRNNLMLPKKYLYFLSMGLNFVLRFAWLLGWPLQHHFASPHFASPHFASLLQASLEVMRRALWNFFRLEYEHVKNAEEFSAV